MAYFVSPEVKTMFTHTDELTKSLTTHTVCIAGSLIGKNVIQKEVLFRMLKDDTPTGEASILIEAVTSEIELAPEKFIEFLGALSEHPWAKDIVDCLHSTYQGEFKYVTIHS